MDRHENLQRGYQWAIGGSEASLQGLKESAELEERIARERKEADQFAEVEAVHLSRMADGPAKALAELAHKQAAGCAWILSQRESKGVQTMKATVACVVIVLGICAAGRLYSVERGKSSPDSPSGSAAAGIIPTSASHPGGSQSGQTPGEVAASRKDPAITVDYRAEVEKKAARTGKHLLPSTFEKSPRYRVRIAIKCKNEMISDDTIETVDGRVNIVETTDVKRYIFLIAKSDDKEGDCAFSLDFEYVYDNMGKYMAGVGIFRGISAPGSGDKASTVKGGSPDEEGRYAYEVVVEQIAPKTQR
jgi:hypothetical protein